jgi:DNA repair protein RadC
MNKKPHYLGHRERLKERFQKVGYLGMHDYELLEMVLCLAIPRGDVKPIAKELLMRFKTLEGVFHADPLLLAEIKGIGPSSIHTLKIILSIHQRMLQMKLHKKHLLTNFEQVLDYCYTHMAFERIEEIRILFLDAKMNLMKDEVHQRGSVTSSTLYVQEIIKKALDLGSTGMILIHNHPSDDTTPSDSDKNLTNFLSLTAKPLNITLHDHIIIGKNGYFSFRQENLLK